MNTHNKLLLLSIAAVGTIGFVGSRLAARMASPAEMATLQEDARTSVRSYDTNYGELLFERAWEGVDQLEVVPVGGADDLATGRTVGRGALRRGAASCQEHRGREDWAEPTGLHGASHG